MRHKAFGFSLFELVVTISVMAVILTVALPSFADTLARNRQRAEIDAFFRAVHLAKKTSIMRNQVISLCPSADLMRCNPGTDWSAGWIMFENLDRDEPPQVDPGESVLRRQSVDSRIVMRANRRGFTFRATLKRATNGTLVVCDAQERIPARAVVVSYTGRPRVAGETTTGRAYDCQP